MAFADQLPKARVYGPQARTGLVRVNGRALADDQGDFMPLLTSLFPAAWAQKHDPARLDHELATIANEGCYHGYRSLTGVNGISWTDRMADPSDVDTILAMAKKGYEQYGLRAMHCLFADGPSPGAETPAQRMAVIDRLGLKLAGHEAHFLALEIVNERDNGNKLSVEETRALAARLKLYTSIPIILSRPGSGFDYTALNTGTGQRLTTMHLERDNSDDGGRWEHLSKAIEFPWGAGDPTACLSGESKGVGSSGSSENNILRLTMAYFLTSLEGMAGHVFHTGAGRGMGRAWDTGPKYLADQPEWAPVSAGYRAMQAYLPPDLANWPRWRGHWGDNPIDLIPYRNGSDNGPFDDGTLFKAFTAQRGHTLWTGILRAMKPFKIRHRTARCLFEVLNPMTGEVREAVAAAAGAWVELHPHPATGWEPDGDGLVIRGTLA